MAPKSKVSDRFPSQDVFFGTSPDLPRIVELDCAKIVWNPDRPRKSIDPVRLQELADSIVTNGLIHPITVKRADADRYMIVAGERRYRAFALLERASIPAIVSEGSTDELALIENIQREDLTPIDEYQAIARLMDKHGYSQGDRTGAHPQKELAGFAGHLQADAYAGYDKLYQSGRVTEVACCEGFRALAYESLQCRNPRAPGAVLWGKWISDGLGRASHGAAE